MWAGLLAALTVPAAAQDVKVEKYKLPNGMTVILHQDRTLPVATINTWFKVGSKDEPDRRSGFAHLFEHLMFMGTKRVPQGQFDVIMETAGGSNNASTSQDRTNYFSFGPSNLLQKLIWLDAERLEALGENIDLKKLDLQRDVVKNERRQSVENAPYGKAYDAINRLMYPAGHPYSWSVIGSMEDLTAASVPDVQQFFSTYYVPNNASIVVAGDFDPALIKPVIAQQFGTIARGNDAPRRSVPDASFKGVRRQTMVDTVDAAKTIMVWHSPAAYRSGDAELNLAAGILADGVSSRLYQKLVVKDKVATEVAAFQQSGQLGSLFIVEATVSDGVSLERLESAIDATLAEFNENGPTALELKQEAAKIEKRTLESLQSIDNKADKLNEYEFYFGEPNSFKRVLDMYRGATVEQVKAVSAETVNPWNRLILRVIPQEPAPKTNPRDSAPAAGSQAPFSPKGPVELVLDNGIKVFYWRREDLPMMNVSTVFKGGTDSDTQTQVGLSALTASMLTQGAGTRTSADFAASLNLLGAEIDTSVSHTTTAVNLSTLTPNFGRALALYADAIARPTFAPSEWERVKRVELADLEQQKSDPSSLAIRVGTREFFGPSHPFGQVSTEGTVGALSVADLRFRHGLTYQPSNAVIFVSGNLPGPAVKFELNKAFRNWASSGRQAPAVTYPPLVKQALRVIIVDKPGAVQSVVRFWMPGVPYSSPERLPLQALGSILGGSFTSRLNQNLREDKGYTYGANARFTFEPTLGYLSSGASVRTDVTGASIKEFLAEFNRFRKEGVTVDETGKAVALLQTSTIESLSTMTGLLSTARRLYENNRAFGTLGEDMTAIRALTESVLDGLTEQSVLLENGILVIVGDKQQILPQLEGLGLPKPIEIAPF